MTLNIIIICESVNEDPDPGPELELLPAFALGVALALGLVAELELRLDVGRSVSVGPGGWSPCGPPPIGIVYTTGSIAEASTYTTACSCNILNRAQRRPPNDNGSHNNLLGNTIIYRF